jgi:hypothetical protein
MTDAQIKETILRSHMRSKKKVIPWVLERLPNASVRRIKEILETLTHDKYMVSRDDPQKHYYYPIFTPFIGGFQIDLVENTPYNDQAGAKQGATAADRFNPYFFVAINVNTKYAYAYPMHGKSADDILPVLDQWYNDLTQVGVGKLALISADMEGGWSGRRVLQWLTNHRCKLKLIESHRHSALGVVDRFIRELRDLNVKSIKELMDHPARGDDRKYRDFTPNRMAHWIRIHNTSFNTSIEMTPEEMENQPDKQKEYIIKKVYELNRRKKISDFELADGTWVRFMIPRNMMEKRRYQFSNQIVQIHEKMGNAYYCEAADGTMKKLARWRLLPSNQFDFQQLPSWTDPPAWRHPRHRRRGRG